MNSTILNQCIKPLVIVLVGIILYDIIKKMLNRMFKIRASRFKNNKYNTLESLIRNIIKYFIILICALMILEIYNVDTKSIITSLGVAGAALALALQDFLKDFVAGMTIVLENQFAIGDTIKVGDFTGEVTSFSLKTTRIKAWTGEEKIMANHLVTEVINYTHHNSMAVLDIGIPYESNLDKVEKVLNKICTNMQNELPNLKGDVTLLGIEKLDSSSIIYRVTVEVKNGEQYTVQRIMRKTIKEELDKNGINIPYNQLVIHNG